MDRDFCITVLFHMEEHHKKLLPKNQDDCKKQVFKYKET